MKKRLLLLAAAFAALLLGVASPALAAGLHWFQNQTPSISVNGSTVEATGQVAGAGTFINADLVVHYTYPVSCYNPGHDTGPVPGQSGSGTSTSPSQTIQANHGNATFDLIYTVPTPTPAAGSCPSNSWTAVAGPVTITSVTLNITSSNGGSLTYTQP